IVTTLAGTGSYGSTNGAGSTARFNYPWAIAADAASNLYVADMLNYKVRVISTSTSLNGIPSKTDVGTHPVSLKATNGSGSSNHDFIITVNDLTAPAVNSYSPVNGATGVQINANLKLTLDETIAKGEGAIFINKVVDNSIFETVLMASSRISVSGNVLTIDPVNELDFNTAYYITIDNGAIIDSYQNHFDGIAAKTTWNFTTQKEPEAPAGS
ncbi:MAG: hypothetical protein EOO00_05290, partial [Chitinophagaceae bacterium]